MSAVQCSEHASFTDVRCPCNCCFGVGLRFCRLFLALTALASGRWLLMEGRGSEASRTIGALTAYSVSDSPGVRCWFGQDLQEALSLQLSFPSSQSFGQPAEHGLCTIYVISAAAAWEDTFLKLAASFPRVPDWPVVYCRSTVSNL